MKLFKHKKGLGLLIFIGLGILFASIMIILLTDTVEFQESIGIKQYTVLHVNEKIEAAQLYLDESLPYAAERAQDNLYASSGIPSSSFGSGSYFASPCGSHIYPLYTSSSFNCLPQFRSAYKLYTQQNLKRYLDAYDSLTLMSSLTLDVISTPQRTTLLRSSSGNTHAIPLASTSALLEEEKLYPRGVLGTYGDEKIPIICGSGHCFGEIATYYHQLYAQANYRFNYVLGGESPYTYEDTLADQQENTNSIFKGISVTQYQTDTRVQTEQGFDASGWLWWVGRHAGLPQFDTRKEISSLYESLEASDTVLCKSNHETLPECTYDFISKNMLPGDILFVEEVNSLSDVLLFVGEEGVSHSQPGLGLVLHDIPTSYLSSTSSQIYALIRLDYPEKGSAYFLTPQTTQEESSDTQVADSIIECNLPIDFTQINEDAIRESRKNILTNTRGAVDDFNQKLYDTKQVDSVAYASSQFPHIAPEYIKAIMMTEIGYGSEAFKYLSGDKTSREGSTIVGPMQISGNACNDVNRDHADSLPCDHDLIKTGGYEGASNGILSGTGYLDYLRVHTNNINKDNPNLYFLALAYNAGAGTLNNVLKHASARTGISEANLEWRDIIRSDVAYATNANGWNDAKTTEVFEYPNHVAIALSGQCNGDIFANYKTSKSTMDFSPQISTIQDIDLESLSLIEEFTSSLITCDDKLRECVENKLLEFNKKYPEYIQITRQGETESIAYEFAEQLLDCSKNGQRDCICDIELDVELLPQEGPSPLSEEETEEELFQAPFLSYGTEDDDLIETLETNIDDLAFELREDGDVYYGSLDFQGDFTSEDKLVSLYAPLNYREDTSTSQPLYLKIDQTLNAHELVSPLGTWKLGEQTEKLALLKQGTFSLQNLEASEKQQRIVEYATQYLGSGYGGVSTCSAEAAVAKACTTQCGSFVTNVFRYGLELPESQLPYGNGIDKCTNSGNLQTIFLNPFDLQPGDIFSSTSLTSTYGHTGIFVGFGDVSNPVKEGYCFNTFTARDGGEPVFIHSVNPVCYNTYTQLFSSPSQIGENGRGGQGRTIQGFCRHKLVEDTSVDQEETPALSSFESQTSETPYVWITYEEEQNKQNLCRDNKNYFRFQAYLPTMKKTIPFSMYLEDSVPPQLYEEKGDLRTCDGKDVAVLEWSVDANSEPIYSFEILETKEGIFSDDGSQTPQTTLLTSLAEDTVQSDPTKLNKLYHLYKRETADVTYYYYLVNRVSNEFLEPETTYQFYVDAIDHYENKIENKLTAIEITTPVAPSEYIDPTTGLGVVIQVADALSNECEDTSGYDSGLFADFLGDYAFVLEGVD